MLTSQFLIIEQFSLILARSRRDLLRRPRSKLFINTSSNYCKNTKAILLRSQISKFASFFIAMRTTITIPDDLAARADALIGSNGITTRNQLIVEALQHWIDLKQEESIDAEFASMAEDADYIVETLAIESEFDKSDRANLPTNLSQFFTKVVDTTIVCRYIIFMSKERLDRHSTLFKELGLSQSSLVPEQEAYLNLVRTHAVLNDEVAKLFGKHNLSQPLYNVLKVVARVGESGIPSQSIARHMVARDPDITRLVDRLKKARLIQRERDEKDRRVVRVKITPAGLDAIAQLDPLILELHQQQLGHLSKKELQLLNELLVKARNKRST